MKVAERVLYPRVREADRNALIISYGFSCREQIMHGTRRHGMHLAEAIQMALHQPPPPRKNYIEVGWVQEEPFYPVLTAASAGLLVTGATLLIDRMVNGRSGRESA